MTNGYVSRRQLSIYEFTIPNVALTPQYLGVEQRVCVNCACKGDEIDHMILCRSPETCSKSTTRALQVGCQIACVN